MGKPGKPNSFLKGMQMDMDPLLQPKDSYRYAKNIRLSSYVGQNISVQPYDSDKLALSLGGWDITTLSTASISNVVEWSVVSDTIYDNWSQLTWQSFFNYITNASIGVDLEQYFNYGTLSSNYDLQGYPSSAYVKIGDWVEPGEFYDDVNAEQVLGYETLPAFSVGGFYINF